MSRQYGNKRRTQKDINAAAVAMATLSSRPREEKIEALIRSYGFTRERAERLVGE